MADSDSALRRLVGAILDGDADGASRLIAASPELTRASFDTGAMRKAESAFFLDRIARYIYAGDTALHIAAAAYQTEFARRLLAAGANVRARNRRGQEPLHAAACGVPGSSGWNPTAQAETIQCLIAAGADPNAFDKSGVAPLHKAVRTRCAVAVRALLESGADAALSNKNGSTPMLLAIQNTGRGGSGSSFAKVQQQEIVRLLRERAPVK